MSILNFSKNIFLEKEELDKFQEFLNDDTKAFLFKILSASFGIVPVESLSGNDFLVEQGSLPGTFKISYDSYALDSDLLLISLKAFDSYPVTAGGAWYWIRVSHRYLNVEPGTVSVNTTGEVTGSGTSFLSYLRSQTSKAPIKIKFYKEDVTGIPQTVTNDGIYEVVDIISNTQMVISGSSFTSESTLKYIIIGSVALGSRITSTQEEGIYSYDNCLVEVVPEVILNTAPTSGYVDGKTFYIARVQNNGGTLTIQDKRDDYRWEFDLGVSLPGKADTDAGNITGATNVPQWLDKLMYYCKDYVTQSLSTNGVVNYSFLDTVNTLYVSGSYSSTSTTITLPPCDSKNKGRRIVVFYNIENNNPYGASSNTFLVRDSSLVSLFSKSWTTDPAITKGYLQFLSDGTNWYYIDIKGTVTGELASKCRKDSYIKSTGASNYIIAEYIGLVIITDEATGGGIIFPDPTGRSGQTIRVLSRGGTTTLYKSNGSTQYPGSVAPNYYYVFECDGTDWLCAVSQERPIACPYIYINGEFFDEILKNFVGIEDKEIIDITDFLVEGENIVSITEEKEEVTYFNSLYYEVNDGAKVKVFNNLILEQGDRLSFKIDFVKGMTIKLIGTGYYLPK